MTGSNDIKTTIQQTVITVQNVTGTTIDIGFKTMHGNMPAEYANFVALWQDEDSIPWEQKPLKQLQIQNNSQTGSVSFDDLKITTNGYILGYSVGSDVTNICSTAIIPANSDNATEYEVFKSSVSLVNLGSTSVTVKYETPRGNMAKTNKNWIGIWEGSNVPYKINPIAKQEINQDNATGNIGINNIDLVRGTTYVIGYFMGLKPTTLAASVSFTIAG